MIFIVSSWNYALNANKILLQGSKVFRLSVEFFSQSTIARLHLQTMLRFPSTTVLLVLLVILSPVFCVPAEKNGTVKLYHPLTCRQEMQGSRFLIFHLRMFLEVQNDKFTNQSFNH